MLQGLFQVENAKLHWRQGDDGERVLVLSSCSAVWDELFRIQIVDEKSI